jgi:hypothetical protein
MILQLLLATLASWINRHQQHVITYLQEENRILKAQLRGRRLRLTDMERRRLAALAHPLGRTCLQEVATIATPDTLMHWYHRLIAQTFEGSQHRRPLGRPHVAEEIEQLVVRMAEENATWGYQRIQGALANLGHRIDAITVRNILRRHHLEPAPQRRQTGMSWAQFLKLHWEVLEATDLFAVEVVTLADVRTSAMSFCRDLATRYVQQAVLLLHRTMRVLVPWTQPWPDRWAGWLLSMRYGSRGEPNMVRLLTSRGACLHCVVHPAKQERSPPVVRILGLLVAARHHPSGRGACASRRASTPSVDGCGGRVSCHDRHGGTCTSSDGAAA